MSGENSTPDISKQEKNRRLGIVLKDKLARAKAKDTMEYLHLLSLNDMDPVFVFTSTNTANSFCQRVINNAAIELERVQASSIILGVTSLTTPKEPLIGRSMSPVRAGNPAQSGGHLHFPRLPFLVPFGPPQRVHFPRLRLISLSPRHPPSFKPLVLVSVPYPHHNVYLCTRRLNTRPCWL
jgi:hypothetical protein